VVCVEDVESQLIQQCLYTGFRQVHRRRPYYDLRIIDPITRLTVAQGRIQGSVPDRCEDEETFGQFQAVKDKTGDLPTDTDLVAWMERFLPP
jgi:hypothetical protein